MAGRGGSGELVLQRRRLAGEAAAQRDAARERLAHGAHHGEVGRHAGVGIPEPDGARAVRASEFGAHEPRQLEVVEEDLHELLARQREHEVVLRVPVAALLLGAAAAALTLRPRDAVARDVFAVARQHELAVAAASER